MLRACFTGAVLCVALLVTNTYGATILIGSDVTADQLFQIDPTTAAVTPIGPLGDPVVASLTFDPIHKILYGSSTQTDNLPRIDPLTGATTVIGKFGVGLMHSIEYNPNNNTLFGVSQATRLLYMINVATGAASPIGATGIADIGGIAFDSVNDIMYATDGFLGLDGAVHDGPQHRGEHFSGFVEQPLGRPDYGTRLRSSSWFVWC